MEHLGSFFLVWNPEGRNPRYRHDTLDGATEEATRLAKANPGVEFYVLETIRKVRVVSPVEVTHFALESFDDRIPF